MKIKTPVQFSKFNSLEDADGDTMLDLDPGSTVGQETKQAIIDAFEDAARWRFMAAASADPTGREMQLMEELTAEMPDAGMMTAGTIAQVVDAARARLAALGK